MIESMEEYRNINGVLVSNMGNTKNGTRRHNGYLVIKGMCYYLHVLVAKAFPEICGEWFDGCHVHHKDFNKLNNCAENLIILSHEQHALMHKEQKAEIAKNIFKGKHHTSESKKKMSESHKGKHLSDKCKQKISQTLSRKVAELGVDGSVVKTWDSIIEASRFYNDFHITEVCRGKRKTAAKRRWKYV